MIVPNVKRHGVVLILRMASLDSHGLMANVKEENWLPTFAYVNEWSFQWCDYITRTTGRLTKLVRLVDCSDTSLLMVNKEESQRSAKAMDTMEDYYPQLLQSVLICDGPIWIQIPWRILRPLLPKRVVSKFDFINPKSNTKELMRLQNYISIDKLPTKFGGNYVPWPIEYPLPL